MKNNKLLAKLLVFGFMGFFLSFCIWQLTIVGKGYKAPFIFLIAVDIVFIIVFAIWFYKKEH